MEGGRTSESHPILVDFVELSGPADAGQLGLTFGPGKKGASYHSAGGWNRDLQQDLDALVERFGMTVLVSLMEDHEFESLHMVELFHEVEARGKRLIHYPITDVSTPPPGSMEDFADLIWEIERLLVEGEAVIVHCRGGMGRTGLVAAAVLTALGQPASEAIASVRRARPGTIETKQQEQYVYSFENYLHGEDHA